ncbi:glucan biosynthesis protein G [Terrarubrum flagellatum]|uniref:glucan biosynthesis protein n=1 Tax=Terrirubrum flagellatum TaxID=2895980 RepID=UPI003144F677
MSQSRRSFARNLGALVATSAAAPTLAQTPPAAQSPTPAPPTAAPAQAPRFNQEDVIRRARDLASRPFDGSAQPLPDALAKLDFDSWRDIRFRPERALLGPDSRFRMQMFHPGFLFQRPVTVNVARDGIAAPVPYSNALFDYGRNKFERPLPVNLGFAGFRLHYPLNQPKVFDELIAFLGASYFRFLGRGQKYGLSARGLAIGAGSKETEEFPTFREFWVEQPQQNDDSIIVHALLDSDSCAGAWQFTIYPGRDTVLDVQMTLFPRKPMPRIGVAPLTSMFFTGENDRRFFDDYRPELHDSDGLLMRTGAGEWIWRPLRNPREAATSSFFDVNPRGFGLMQRDRTFEHYQDLDLNYETRPSYWVEPRGDWGEGRVDLVEIPTSDETNDNIVVAWAPKNAPDAGQTITLGYRISALLDSNELHPGGKAINTWQTSPRALGSAEKPGPGQRRFIVDFAGGDLSYYQTDPSQVQIVPSISNGRILRTFLIPNAQTEGFRAGVDIEAPPGQMADLRAFLKAGSRTLTETWTFPWKAE